MNKIFKLDINIDTDRENFDWLRQKSVNSINKAAFSPDAPKTGVNQKEKDNSYIERNVGREYVGKQFPIATIPSSEREKAKQIGDKLGIDWDKINIREFEDGINEELEHSDITGGDLEMTGKIALAHLKEEPEYYSKLKQIMKSKIYFQPEKGEKAPEGVQVHRGSEGGAYYYGETSGMEQWKGLHQEQMKISPKGTNNLKEVTGHSKDFLVEKILNMSRDYGTSLVTMDTSKPFVEETLDFLDFYIRLANDSKNISDSELDRISVKIEKGIRNHLESLKKRGYKRIADKLDNILREEDKKLAAKIGYLLEGKEKVNFYNILKYGDRSEKIIAIDKFVSIGHSVEPTIIPHVFGVEFSGIRIPLQFYIVTILDYLAGEEQKMEKSFVEIRKQNRLEKQSPGSFSTQKDTFPEHENQITPAKKVTSEKGGEAITENKENFFEKGKIYFQSEKGEKAPPGVFIQEGSRGGKYYETETKLAKPILESGVFDKAPEPESMNLGYRVSGDKIQNWLKQKKEVKERIEDWKSDTGRFGPNIPMSDKQIIYNGYQWRHWAHTNNSQWEWAMWEEIQKLASKYGYKYKDKLTKEDLFDNPEMIDYENILGSELEGDTETTNYRNTNNKTRFAKFIRSEQGKKWRIRSLRTLAGHVRQLPEDKIKEWYPDFFALLEATSWGEILNTDIIVYRGILGKKEDNYKNPIISYTTCPKVAEKFARGYVRSYDAGPDAGMVLKRKVKFGDLLGYLNPDGENEVILPPPVEKIEKEEDYAN